MKRMNYGNMACEVSVSENYVFYSEVICTQDKDKIAYAVERFLSAMTKKGLLDNVRQSDVTRKLVKSGLKYVVLKNLKKIFSKMVTFCKNHAI